MSKLLTDLMEAERKRRRLAVEDAPAGASGQEDADPAAAAAATAAQRPMAGALAASRPAETRPEEDVASPKGGPQRIPWRLFAATALALMAGIGTGFWLGKPPATAVRPLSDDQGALRLRLDDRLMNLPAQGTRAVPRDRSQ